MSDKGFDKHIRRKLQSFETRSDSSSWKDLEDRLNSELEESGQTTDELVRNSLAGYSSQAGQDWSRMKAQLEEAETESFDKEVKSAMGRYRKAYDASTWPVLLQRYREAQVLRRRYIAAKVLEVAAVLIAAFTFYNFFPHIRQHISNAIPISAVTAVQPSDDLTEKYVGYESTSQTGITPGKLSTLEKTVVPVEPVAFTSAPSPQLSVRTHEQVKVPTTLARKEHPFKVDETLFFNSHNDIRKAGQGVEKSVNGESISGSEAETSRGVEGIEPLISASVGTGVSLNKSMAPAVTAGFATHQVKVTLGGSYDMNALYLPADRFYADGFPIDFSEKNILASGYSAGAGVLFDYGVWSFETGIYYSSKSYEPNRVLQIGQTFDVRTLDFQKISLHIINIPLQAHWNFDRKGKTRFYLVGGIGFDLLASANYDLNVRKNFRSPFTGSNVQTKKRTDSQVARVREHILDGAEFSGKSFITANAGIGVEHSLGGRMSIFAQPTYSYQVPFLQFSDKEGKHFQYASLQFGTRIRIR